MTDKLIALLEEEYPPLKGNTPRVHTYEAQERIYLFLPEPEMINNPVVRDGAFIKDIAANIFDVNFVYKKLEDIDGIYFEPKWNDAYHLRHDGHHIWLHLPQKVPEITISTGNRGHPNLFDKQRENYFSFVKQVVEHFKGLSS